MDMVKRTWRRAHLKAIAAVVGAGAAASMVAVLFVTSPSDVVSQGSPQPLARMGKTATWEPPTTTIPPSVPAVEKAVPTVKAPHR